MVDIDAEERVFECQVCGTVQTVHGFADECRECDGEDLTHIGDVVTRRAKWMWDGSESINDMISRTEDKMNELQEMKEDGWDVDPFNTPVDDDYAYLVKFKDGYSHDDFSD